MSAKQEATKRLRQFQTDVGELVDEAMKDNVEPHKIQLVLIDEAENVLKKKHEKAIV